MTPRPTSTSSSSSRGRPAATTGRPCRISTATHRRPSGPARSSPRSTRSSLHYLTPIVVDPGDPGTPEDDELSCEPTGTSGTWNAISGAGDGWETWTVQLADAGGSPRQVELSISYASDFFVQGRGVILDQVVVSTGEGSTGFEADGNPLDGWTHAGGAGPEPAKPEHLDRLGLRARTSRDPARERSLSFDRQPEIIAWEAGHLRCVSVERVGRRRPGRGRRVRPREPDATGLLAILLRRRGQRLRRRPRARPPVVRRLPRGRHVERDLAERGLRDLHRMDVGRARGLLHAAGRLRRPDVDPGRRRVLGPADRRPRHRQTSSRARSTIAAR